MYVVTGCVWAHFISVSLWLCERDLKQSEAVHVGVRTKLFFQPIVLLRVVSLFRPQAVHNALAVVPESPGAVAPLYSQKPCHAS